MKRVLLYTMTGLAAVAMAATVQAGSSITTPVNVGWSFDTTGTIVTSSVVLPEVASIKSITIELAHTWGNDLDIYVDAPGGGTRDFDLMFNEFAPTTTNFDLGLVAGSGALSNVAPYTWDGTIGPNNWTAPWSPPGTYNANAWMAGPIAGGTYTLYVGDVEFEDGGAIGSWTIVYNEIPAPGALSLLALAGMVGGRRRRG